MTCLCRHRGEVAVQLQPILNLSHEGGGWSALRHCCFTPRKDQVPVIQEAGWALGLVLMAQKILHPSGFDPQNIQSVAVHYTDYCSIPLTEA